MSSEGYLYGICMQGLVEVEDARLASIDKYRIRENIE